MSSSGSSDFWTRLEDLFNQALELDPSARSKFVEEVSTGDPRLRDELESLLRSSRESGDFLEHIVHTAAHDVVVARTGPLLAAGSRFAHYEIVSTLGAGGMGQVYLARDLQLGRSVALKTLLPDAARDEDSLRRFKQEAQAASALNHPNILTIYEVGEFAGTHFIASEFIEGQTLREKLAAGRLPLSEVVGISVQIAAGPEAAHDAGIVHRDIKPENVIVRNDGLAKIVDFGIARVSKKQTSKKQTSKKQTSKKQTSRKQTSRSTALVSDTRPGMVMGTARYMSPEQARGTLLDARTDIFSLGAVMYEMASGRAPFEGATDSDLLAEILKTDPQPFALVVPPIVPPVPKAFAGIVAKAMCKDRDQRYQTVGDLHAQLRIFREDLDFHARVKSSSRSQWRFALIAAIVCIALLGGYYARNLTSGSPSRAPRSLAILPFRNIRQDPATDFLGYSLADAVITKMGYVSSLVVRPSSSIDRYRNQVVDPRKAGAELNVDALLTGSFIKDGDDLRINTQLIDVRHVRILWRDTIDVKYEKLLTVQDRVAQQIIDGLALNLSPAETGHLKFDNPITGSAYELYLRGVDLYALNDFSAAIQALEKSASMDPRYALTWAHLGRAYTTNASLHFGGRDQYRKALDSYRKAIALNPALIEPRVYMANLFTDTGRVEEAVPLLLEALKSNQNSAEAHWELGYAYRFGGLLPASEKESERARQLDPEVKINSSALNTYLYLGEYDKFLASLPVHDSAYILFYRGFGEYYKKDYPRAAAYFDRAFALDPSLLQANVGEALADATRHNNTEGLRLLRKTEARIRESGLSDPEGIYKVSQTYAVLGDDPSARRLLRDAIAGGFFCYPYFETDPLIAHLRTESETTPLLNQARNRYEQFRARFSSL